MSKVVNVVCDAPTCNQVRGQTNHWWLIRKNSDGGFMAYPMSGTGEYDGDRHICGRQCLQAMLEEWMQNQMTKPSEETH
jgi:hypothetical protein